MELRSCDLFLNHDVDGISGFKAGAKHEPASDFSAPVFYSTLKSSQLAGPTRSDIGQHQAVNVTSGDRLPTVRDHVHLEVPRRWIVPIVERPYNDALSQRCIETGPSVPLLRYVSNWL